MAQVVIPRTALLEAVIVVEVAVAPIAVATINHTNLTSRTSRTSRTNLTNHINHTQATAMASSPPTDPRALHPTPAPLLSPATPSLSNRRGTPNTASIIPRRTHRTLLCPPRTTTQTMPLKSTSNNRPTVVSPHTNRLLNLPTARHIRLRARPVAPRPNSGELTRNNLRPMVRMAVVGVAAAAATMIGGRQKDR
jgi:hypothetical protein